MHIDISVKKLPEPITEGEEAYEAFAVSDTGEAMGAIGSTTGKALLALHKKLKNMRKFVLLALPLLQLKHGQHSYTFKVNDK